MPAPLITDISDVCFFDTETRGVLRYGDNPDWADVTKCGAARYAKHSMVSVFEYAIGDGPVQRWNVNNFDERLDWRKAPAGLRRFLHRARLGEGWFVAWNSFFDRHVVNGGMVSDGNDETMPVRTVLCAMAQAVASNLPAKLEGASRAIGRDGKMDEGKHLIQLFAPHDGAEIAEKPEEWENFLTYADRDVEELRAVFKATRPLWSWEWEEFWSSETINDTGLPFDRHFAERAAALASVYAGQVNDLVSEFTHGVCYSVNQHVALANNVADRLDHHPDAINFLVKRYDEDDETGDLQIASLSLERARVEKLIPFLERLDKEQGLTDDEYDVLQLLETRLYGASSTPKKFAKLLPMLTEDDRLCGQYTMNGAQQTGRFSSRGVQVHNLTRAFLGIETNEPGAEAAAIEAVSALVL